MLVCRLPYEEIVASRDELHSKSWFDSQINYIDNWCTCDNFCSGMCRKIRKHREEFLELKVDRLLDEKRRSVRLDDEIIFINRADDNDRVRAKVIGLLFYKTFAELVPDYDIEILMGRFMTKNDLIAELNKFYSAEKQAELGVVGIRFELI